MDGPEASLGTIFFAFSGIGNTILVKVHNRGFYRLVGDNWKWPKGLFFLFQIVPCRSFFYIARGKHQNTA
jgi:hypothetical protein